jgi:integral membrane protein
MSEQAPAPTIDPAQIPGIRGALIRYRVMAYLVGTLLIVLVLVGVPLKYLADNATVVTFTGVPHGYLYMILLVTAYDLGRRVHWPWKRLILIGLAGTVPFLSFVAEYYARKDVQARVREVELASMEAEPSDG